MYPLECLKADYKQYGIPGKEQSTGYSKATYPNCTMPWQQSMKGDHWSPDTYNQDDVKTCNETDMSILYSLDYEYLKVAARSKNPNCLGKVGFSLKKE